MIEIIPAILEQSPDMVADKLKKAVEFAKTVQIDITDGQFVPSTSVSCQDIASIAEQSPLSIEWHLMVKDPARQLNALKKFSKPKNIVIVHYESQPDVQGLFDQIKGFGLLPALAINPETAVNLVAPYAAQVEFVVILGVHPGFQGRAMKLATIDRISQLRQLAPEGAIEVDGGVKQVNIDLVAQASANRIVVGSALWKSVDPKIEFVKLTNLANKV